MPNSTGRPVLGYVGYVMFDSVGMVAPPSGVTWAGDTWLRATSADIRGSQTIEKPDVVDGKTDRTVYQLGPVEIGGGIAFPAVYEKVGGSDFAPAETMWRLAMQRYGEFAGNDIAGDLGTFNTNVKYTTGTGFTYGGCAVNTYEFAITQGDVLNINMDVVGVSRYTYAGVAQRPEYQLRNTRIITWNDVVVQLYNGENAIGVNSNCVMSRGVRDFSVTCNNNIDRHYTLNGQLFPAAVLPGKRDLEGSLTFLGREPGLADFVFSATDSGDPLVPNVQDGNLTRCTEKTAVRFGYKLGLGGGLVNADDLCTSSFLVDIPGAVFEMEELNITNEVFETTVAFHILPGVEYLGVTPAEERSTDFVVAGAAGGVDPSSYLTSCVSS